MKKVLLIAYHYYKSEMVASNRTHAIFDYLPEYGYDVTLITSKQNESATGSSGKVISISDNIGFLKIYFKLTGQNSWGISSYKNTLNNSPHNKNHISKNTSSNNSSPLTNLITKIMDKSKKLINNNRYLSRVFDELYHLFSMIYFPDLSSGWYKPTFKAGLKELTENKYDAIISTSGPFTSHKIANKLHRKTGVPWIADYRDLWSDRDFTSFYVTKKRKSIEKNYEKKIISECNVITTVSAPLANDLANMHHKKTVVITNGFDPVQVNQGVPLNNKFVITYTGSLYSRTTRDPSILFSAIHSLVNDGVINLDDIDIRFYGAHSDWLDEDIKKYNLESVARQYGMVPKSKAIDAQRSSQILLLLLWNEKNGDGAYSGKLFEYIIAKRPIIALGRKSIGIENILIETKSGVVAQSSDETKLILEKLYNEYKSIGYVSYLGDESKFDKYSYKEMAHQYAKLLDKF